MNFRSDYLEIFSNNFNELKIFELKLSQLEEDMDNNFNNCTNLTKLTFGTKSNRNDGDIRIINSFKNISSLRELIFVSRLPLFDNNGNTEKSTFTNIPETNHLTIYYNLKLVKGVYTFADSSTFTINSEANVESYFKNYTDIPDNNTVFINTDNNYDVLNVPFKNVYSFKQLYNEMKIYIKFAFDNSRRKYTHDDFLTKISDGIIINILKDINIEPRHYGETGWIFNVYSITPIFVSTNKSIIYGGMLSNIKRLNMQHPSIYINYYYANNGYNSLTFPNPYLYDQIQNGLFDVQRGNLLIYDLQISEFVTYGDGCVIKTTGVNVTIILQNVLINDSGVNQASGALAMSATNTTVYLTNTLFANIRNSPYIYVGNENCSLYLNNFGSYWPFGGTGGWNNVYPLDIGTNPSSPDDNMYFRTYSLNGGENNTGYQTIYIYPTVHDTFYLEVTGDESKKSPSTGSFYRSHLYEEFIRVTVGGSRASDITRLFTTFETSENSGSDGFYSYNYDNSIMEYFYSLSSEGQKFKRAKADAYYQIPFLKTDDLIIKDINDENTFLYDYIQYQDICYNEIDGFFYLSDLCNNFISDISVNNY